MKNALFIIILFLFLPIIAFAQDEAIKNDSFFKAKVIDIIEQRINILPDGSEAIQQNLLLKGLEGEYKNKEINFNGIGNFDVIGKSIYKIGDKVMVVESFGAEGGSEYYITDYVRTQSLGWLIAVFVVSLFIVGRWKGLRSILALALTFFVIIKYIIPQILSGANPVFVTVAGSFVILLIIIYITEGFRPLAHISAISIFFSLMITIFISWVFVFGSKLTGVSSEEVSFLINIGDQAINFRGLLLAGIIIGALGVLDDVVISQTAAVEQIAKANYSFSKYEVFKRSYEIGISHIASMSNTLFLAYAGASLPLLVLFISGQSAFTGWGQIINNEAIATEIIRTLSGSIGLILSVPITTFVAVLWYKK